jgi:hypothetical protein
MVGIEMISRNLNPGQDKREMMQVKTAVYRDGHTVRRSCRYTSEDLG